MSRIGKKPVPIPSGVTVTASANEVTVKGPKGELRTPLLPGVIAEVEGGHVVVRCAGEDRQTRGFHGLIRSLVANNLQGVSQGFKKDLEIEGVGYRAALQGKTLSIALGFASPVEYAVPDGIKLVIDGNGTKIQIEGVDKQQVGEVAARIRAFYPAEPYKGKGIRYKNEKVRRKVGKTVA